MAGQEGRSVPIVRRVIIRAARAFSTMLIAMDGRRLPDPPLDASKPPEYRP
jgi:hypothetical protein